MDVSGTLETEGSWTTMFYGCGQWKNVRDSVSFRVGGDADHQDEFIHGVCNDYVDGTNQNNGITSKW